MKGEDEQEISASSAVAKESVALETTVTTAMDTPPTESREEEPMQTSSTNEKEGAESVAVNHSAAVNQSTESQDKAPEASAARSLQETGSAFMVAGVKIVDDNKPMSEFDNNDEVCMISVTYYNY